MLTPWPCCRLQLDEDADVAAVWQEVWEEATSSSGAGLRLHMPEVVQVRGTLLCVWGVGWGVWGGGGQRSGHAAVHVCRMAISRAGAVCCAVL